MRKLAVFAAVAVVLGAPSAAGAVEFRSLDGSGNNIAHPDWGQAGTQYARVGPVNYANGFSSLVNSDRFFYANDSYLGTIFRRWGVDYRVTLADVIAANADSTTQTNAFSVDGLN